MQNAIRLSCAVAVLTVLTACGGEQSFTARSDAMQTLTDRIGDTAVTEAVPVTGTASYKGFAGFVTGDARFINPTPDLVDADSVEVLSRLSMTADFRNSTITGQMTDFIDAERGRLSGTMLMSGTIGLDGFDGEATGTLSTLAGASSEWQADFDGLFLGSNSDFVQGDMLGTATSASGSEFVYGVFVGQQ